MASPPPRDTDRDFAATLHEVANALTVMLGWLEAADQGAHTAVEGDGNSGAALREASEAIKTALARARRAHRIARRAIALPAFGETDGSEPEPLGAILDEAHRGLLHEARRKNVSLECKVRTPVAAATIVAGDRLLQVLTNLLLNALSVTPSGGEIRIEATLARDSDGQPGASPGAVITISDGGPGIPSADRAYLFQRGASSRPGGAGIGLAHAQSIALEEGGLLSLAAYEPQRGARFELAWPLFDGAPNTSPRTLRPAQLHGMRVAVLEDDHAIVELLETVLGARGASVVAAKNLEALREELGTRRADVALVDASPLGVDLEPTLRSLKADFPGSYLVLISGSPDPGVTAERLAVTWIRKPFEVTEVVEVLRLVRSRSGSGSPGQGDIAIG
ncbi:MAG: hypothetical protein HOV80_29210 [Polyangiaceae bacterium]|nr:hypothetical protein [Polyangiaceae bacterium]